MKCFIILPSFTPPHSTVSFFPSAFHFPAEENYFLSLSFQKMSALEKQTLIPSPLKFISLEFGGRNILALKSGRYYYYYYCIIIIVLLLLLFVGRMGEELY
jgi:hypothetical protein